MVLPEVPGIIDATVAITSEPDGRVSLRVVVGAANSGRSSGCDLVELIIDPGPVERALAGLKVRATADTGDGHEPPTFPCHIGFHRSAVHTAA